MKNLTAQRIWFVLLVATQAAMLSYIWGEIAFPVALTIVALVGISGRVQFDIGRKWKTNLTALLIAFFFIKAQMMTREIPPFSAPDSGNAYHSSFAELFVTLQVAHLFLRSGLPSYVCLLAILGMLFAGEQRLPPQMQMIYRLSALGFGVMLIAFLTSGARHQSSPARPTRRLGWLTVLCVLTLLTCGLAWVGSEMAMAIERNSERIFDWLQGGSQGDRSTSGFSSRPWFESIRHFKQNGENSIALRVYSSRPPGYLRGRAFTDVSLKKMGGWSGPLRTHTVTPTSRVFSGLPPLEKGENLFEMRKDAPDWAQGASTRAAWWTLDVHPSQQIEDALFSPLGAALLAARLKLAGLDTGGIAQSAVTPIGRDYRFFVPPVDERENLSSETAKACLSLPEDMDPRIRQLAANVLRGASTPRAKMDAIASYFRTNYKYELGVIYEKIPKGKDAIPYFMLEKLPAHCEYFASGAAVLLRLGGVPCRYVSGFVASEKNRFGGYWVARNRDAHAWVEAYDSETRTWRIVEATPSAGVPSQAEGPESGSLSERWDAAGFYLKRLWNDILNGDIKTRLLAASKAAMRWALHSPVQLLTVCCVVVASIYLIRLARARRRRRVPHRDPMSELAQRLLGEMERVLKRHGLLRLPTETPHRFASRIESQASNLDTQAAAAWYREYADMRYSGRMDLAGIERLRGLRDHVLRLRK